MEEKVNTMSSANTANTPKQDDSRARDGIHCITQQEPVA